MQLYAIQTMSKYQQDFFNNNFFFIFYMFSIEFYTEMSKNFKCFIQCHWQYLSVRFLHGIFHVLRDKQFISFFYFIELSSSNQHNYFFPNILAYNKTYCTTSTKYHLFDTSEYLSKLVRTVIKGLEALKN